MRVVPGLDSWPRSLACGAVALGVFDGVHTGHRAIISNVIELSGDLASCVVTFDPHPSVVLGRPSPEFLTSFEQKCSIMERLSLDALVLQRFSPEFAALPHEDFSHALHSRLGPKHVVVGQNFHYGKGGAGDASTLNVEGERLGFKVTALLPVVVDGTAVSSTAIRALIKQGRLDEACRMLGRSYSIRGVVVRGDGRGRSLGFPTANVEVRAGQLVPPYGVYAARAVLRGTVFPAMLNLGTRPTFVLGGRTLEVHIIGFSGSIYGDTLDVEFIQYLRPEQRFEHTSDLTRQMSRDREDAQAALRARSDYSARAGFVYNTKGS
jgi:riboflavin kinase/FMN adenylyltransferase